MMMRIIAAALKVEEMILPKGDIGIKHLMHLFCGNVKMTWRLKKSVVVFLIPIFFWKSELNLLIIFTNTNTHLELSFMG